MARLATKAGDDSLHGQHEEARARLEFLHSTGAIPMGLFAWFWNVLDGLVDAADVEINQAMTMPCIECGPRDPA